jgi:hypothetical protein
MLRRQDLPHEQRSRLGQRRDEGMGRITTWPEAQSGRD